MSGIMNPFPSVIVIKKTSELHFTAKLFMKTTLCNGATIRNKYKSKYTVNKKKTAIGT